MANLEHAIKLGIKLVFQVDCVKRLVECGLNIDVPEGRFEQSATHLAAFAGHVNVLQWLLENGAFPQKVVSIVSNNDTFLDYVHITH